MVPIAVAAAPPMSPISYVGTVPNTRLVKMSRPAVSVPSRWREDGASDGLAANTSTPWLLTKALMM